MLGINSCVRSKGWGKNTTGIIVGEDFRMEYQVHFHKKNSGWYEIPLWIVRTLNHDIQGDEITLRIPKINFYLPEVLMCDEPVKQIGGSKRLESECILQGEKWVLA